MSGPYIKTKDTTESHLREEDCPKSRKTQRSLPVFMVGNSDKKIDCEGVRLKRTFPIAHLIEVPPPEVPLLVMTKKKNTRYFGSITSVLWFGSVWNSEAETQIGSVHEI